MLIFRYLQIILIKIAESGICDDQTNQAGIHGPSDSYVTTFDHKRLKYDGHLNNVNPL